VQKGDTEPAHGHMNHSYTHTDGLYSSVIFMMFVYKNENYLNEN